MGQIVKRKKKGRPSKADLARRSGGGPASSESEPRRSLRRRNVRYSVDFDDFLEEDDEDEEEDERRREKKLKLVVKLSQQGRDGENLSPVTGLSRSEARDEHAPEYGSSASEGEDEPERKPLKKRRIDGGGEEEEEDEDEDYDDQIRGDDENEDDEIDEVLNKNRLKREINKKVINKEE